MGFCKKAVIATFALGLLSLPLQTAQAQFSNLGAEPVPSNVQLPNGQVLGDTSAQQTAPTEKLPDWMSYKNPYAGEQNDKAQPHRSASEIITWTSDKGADALSFSPQDLNIKLGRVKPLFTAIGWRGYSDFMRSSGILDNVQSKGYTVGAIVDGEATILNQGAISGTYHWLIDLPVIISFSQTSSDGENRQMAGGNFRLTLQLGRVSGDVLTDDLVIENWKVATR